MGTRTSKVADLSTWGHSQLRFTAETEAGLQKGAAQSRQDYRSVDRHRWYKYGYVFAKMYPSLMLKTVNFNILLQNIRMRNI